LNSKVFKKRASSSFHPLELRKGQANNHLAEKEQFNGKKAQAGLI
jgi:hypothetical protein